MTMRKKGIKDWDILMGRPVIIEVFHILTDDGNLTPGDFRNNGIGWQIHIDANILKECIEAGDNTPYWDRDLYYMRCDIRNPKHRGALEAVLKQFGF